MAITALTTVFIAKPDITKLPMMRASGSYSCNDIVFSETVGNSSASADIEDLSAKGVTSLNCSMTNWTNANYMATMTDSAIKIGGSKSGKYSGSVKLTLNGGMTASRAIVYSTGWSGDTSDLQLGVNGSYQSVTTTSDSAYVFSSYIFDFNETSELIFSNNPSATGKSRIVISKIVLRLYGEQSGGGDGGGDTPVDPPVDPPVSSTVEFSQEELAVSSQTITKGDVTLTNSSEYSAAVTELRIYKGQTLTVAATGMTKIEFTCTASGTTKYGPGCVEAFDGYSYSAKVGTWAGSADSVTFTASTNQVRITALTVTIG